MASDPPITLTRDQADELSERIEMLMRNWHQNPMGSDYCCEFCGKEAETNRQQINHDPECDGVRFLNLLKG